MTNKFCDSPIHKVSSLVLAFIILAFCFLPSFVSADEVEPSPSPTPIRPNPPIGYKDGDTFRDIIAVVLDSWGISFSNTPGGNTLAEDMDELLSDFYADQDTLAGEFWASAQYGVNQLGQLILDNTTLGKIIQFADWLIDSYNLSNNSSVPVAGVSNQVYFGDHLAFEITSSIDTIPISYTRRGNPVFEGVCNVRITNSNGDMLGYPIYVTNASFTSGSNIKSAICFYSPIRFRYWVLTALDNSWSFQSGTYTAGQNYDHSPTNDGQLFSVLGLPTYQVSRLSSEADISTNVFNNGVITSRPSVGTSMVINTTVINIPDPDPDEGLKVDIPGTDWGDSIFTILDLIERLLNLYDSTQLNINSVVELVSTLLQGLQQSVTVENIPGAVILDYDDYDIPLENEWGLFDIFYNTEGDEITLLRPWQELKSIIYGFPAPVLSLFALVVLFIVAYGFIRMGRDSH